MTERKCNCLECRVRAALFGGDPTGASELFEIDTVDAMLALGNIMGELLAHHDEKCAEAFAMALLDHRKQWLADPRVAVQ